MLEISEVIVLATQVEALCKRIDSLSLLKPTTVMACDACGEGHMVTDCPIVGIVH